MEIDITDLFYSNTREFLDSIVNSGDKNIGRKTWEAAQNAPFSYVTEKNKHEFISYFDEFGAWDDLADWPLNELNALFIQYASGDIQEFLDLTEDDWDKYNELSRKGTLSGSLYQNSDKICFDLTH